MNEEPLDLSPDELEAARQEIMRQRIAELKGTAISDLQQIRAELKRRQWRENGPLWAEERLGDFLWSKQREVMQAVRQNRKTVVASCHEIGKSRIAAVIAAWWLDIFPPGEAFVVTTAPTTAQVKSILWREIGRAYTRGNLNGRVNQTEWYMDVDGKEEIVAFGRKPDEYDPAAFQGIHAQNVLVIIDEANGVRGPLHDAADSLIANDNSKLLMIGNPDDPSGEFYEACKQGSGHHVIFISAFDSPNFTGEAVPQRVANALIGKIYVEERRKRWAPKWLWVDAEGSPCEIAKGVRVVPPPGEKVEDTHPFWQSKILGQFPQTPQGVRLLIPLPWIKAAQQRTLEMQDSDEVILGCDVGGGSDESTIAMRKGPVVRIVKQTTDPDTMKTLQMLAEQIVEWKAKRANVDTIGIGKGMVDRGKELELPVVGVNVGKASFEPDRFGNLRAQFYWYVRTLFEIGQIDIDPADDELEDELTALRYKPGDKGKIFMESKEDARKRGVASPNKADALMLAVIEDFLDSVTEDEFVAFANANAELSGDSRWGFSGAQQTTATRKPTQGHE